MSWFARLFRSRAPKRATTLPAHEELLAAPSRAQFGQLSTHQLEKILGDPLATADARDIAQRLLDERAGRTKRATGHSAHTGRARQERKRQARSARTGDGQGFLAHIHGVEGTPLPASSHTALKQKLDELVAVARAGNVAEVKTRLASTTFDAEALGNALFWILAKYGSNEPSTSRIQGAAALVEAGADVNHKMAKYGDTALGSAVVGGEVDVVEFLIGLGANPLRPEGALSGQTPLERALAIGNSAIVGALQRARGTATSPDEFVEAARNGAAAIVSAALDAGMSVDVRDKRGYPALVRAAAEGHAATVALLLERGASPNATSDDGAETALTAAVVGRSLEAVTLLVNAGASLGLRRSYDNAMPLAVAEWLGRNDIARFLRERGDAAVTSS